MQTLELVHNRQEGCTKVTHESYTRTTFSVNVNSPDNAVLNFRHLKSAIKKNLEWKSRRFYLLTWHRPRGSLFFMDSELPLLTTDKPDIACIKYFEILYYSAMKYDIKRLRAYLPDKTWK